MSTFIEILQQDPKKLKVILFLAGIIFLLGIGMTATSLHVSMSERQAIVKDCNAFWQEQTKSCHTLQVINGGAPAFNATQ